MSYSAQENNDMPNKSVSKLWKEIFINPQSIDPKLASKKKKEVELSFPDNPIIIGGCGRSGTTILHSILAAHPEVYAIPAETAVFCPTAYGALQTPADFSEIDYNAPFSLDVFYGKCFNEDIPTGCKRWAEKTPRNVLFFERILEHFKKRVRIIHIVRDGRDVVLSKHPTNPNTYWVDPERWVAEVEAGLKFLNHSQVYTLRYEDLILDFEHTLESVLSFLNLPFSNELYEWYDKTTYRRDPSWTGEVKPLHAGSVGKWKHEKYTQRVEELLKEPRAIEILNKLGYKI